MLPVIFYSVLLSEIPDVLGHAVLHAQGEDAAAERGVVRLQPILLARRLHGGPQHAVPRAVRHHLAVRTDVAR